MGYRGGEGVPVMRATPSVSEVKTSISASTQSSGSALVDEYIFVSTDTAIWVKVGSNPTAAAGDDWFLPAGQMIALQAEAGDKVAVIAA
jgi:hypothetical protein